MTHAPNGGQWNPDPEFDRGSCVAPPPLKLLRARQGYDDVVRIISARKANKKEEPEYWNRR